MSYIEEALYGEIIFFLSSLKTSFYLKIQAPRFAIVENFA